MQMPPSFWVFLVVSLVSFVPAILEHKERWLAFKSSTGKARIRLGLLLFVLWATWVFSTLGTIISGFEAKTADRENAERDKKADEDSSNLRALQERQRPRTVTQRQMTNFIFLTERIPKVSVRVLIGSKDEESFDYAVNIRRMFDSAGFRTPDVDMRSQFGVYQDPTAIVIAKSGHTDPGSHVVLITKEPNDFSALSVVFENTNGLRRPIIRAGDLKEVLPALMLSLSEIGITYEWNDYANFVGTNDCAIYVRQKPY